MRKAMVSLTLLALVGSSPLTGQSLRAVTADSNNSVIVFADGNLRSALGQGSDAGQNAAGSLGVGYHNGRLGAEFVINAVGQADPVRANFGTSLLAPGSGSSLSAGLLELTYRMSTQVPICGTLLARGYATAGSSEWIDSASTTSVPEQKYGVVTGGGGLGLRCEFLGGKLTDGGTPASAASNQVAVFMDVGPAFRTIGGDIASTTNDAVRARLLGTADRPHFGIELGLGIQVNGLKAGMTFYGFRGEVPGLSDGQVVAGFSVQTPLFQGNLSPSHE